MEPLTKDYINDCNWDVYLDTYFKDPTMEPRILKNLHKFWSQLEQSDLKVLDYGGGANITRLISACPRVEDFVFAEYTESGRKSVSSWIDKDSKAYDWKDTFAFIVQKLERKGPQEVAKREDELRQKIRAIVPCDIKADNILTIPANLGQKYGPLYDVVITSLCLEAVVESEKEYKDTVTKLAKFVKPGGYLIMHGVIHQTFYMIGAKKFYTFDLSKEMVADSMKSAGVKDIKIDVASPEEEFNHMPLSDAKDEFFMYGRL